jgi:16S rRNA (uracil1498-N3)-methyltransferase
MMSHKKIHRFLVETIPAANPSDLVTINDSRVAKQINRVLKIRPGEAVQVFVDEGPQYTLTISETTDFTITGTITAIETIPVPPRTIIAAVSIVKSDAFDLLVQKLTEIGVSTIVPIISGRTIKQDVRLNRLQAISDEAVEQSGGTKRVAIVDPLSLSECLARYPFQSVVLDPVSSQTTLTHYADTIVCYVGPEGGWNEDDEKIISDAECQHLQITTRVLRTETAAIIGVYKLVWEK